MREVEEELDFLDEVIEDLRRRDSKPAQTVGKISLSDRNNRLAQTVGKISLSDRNNRRRRA